jgi:hypothetical protein
MSTAYTLANILRHCGQYIDPLLIAPEALAVNYQLAEAFPLSFSEAIGFEAYLDGGPSISGFAFNVQANSVAWDMLARTRPGLADSLFTDPAWGRLQALASANRDDESWLYDLLHTLWLEFDITRPTSLVPDVFLATNPAPNPLRKPLPANAMFTLIPEILTGYPVQPPVLEAIKKCWAVLPPEATGNQLGLMLGRPVQALRAVLSFRDPRQSLPYLAALGWPDPDGALRHALDWAVGLADWYTFQVDVTDRLLPRIGFELRFWDAADPANKPRWQEMLSVLVAQGLCSREKQAALMAYSGISIQQWTLPVMVHRGLSHVKLLIEPGKATRSKIYLGALLDWDKFLHHFPPQSS